MAKTSEETPLRKSVITIGVSRLLNTAQYENIQITLNAQEEVTWTTLAERDKKIDTITTLLAKKYQETQSSVLGELGVTEKVAWRKLSPAQTEVRDNGKKSLSFDSL